MNERNHPVYSCRGCGKEDPEKLDVPVGYHPWARYDIAGIYAGTYCDACMAGGKFPYRIFDDVWEYYENAAAHGESVDPY